MRWFTSDLHIGHRNIIEFSNRPFWHVETIDMRMGPAEFDAPDIVRHDKALLDNYNDLVADDDEVWFVGDLALGHQRTTVPWCSQFKGRKFLIPGNHDACHPMHKKYKKFVGLYEDAGFEIMPCQGSTAIAGRHVTVCHFPWWEEFHHGKVYRVDKFSGLRPDNDGSWLIHGHTHSKERVTKNRQIHVGVDAWDLCPVSEDQIAEIIRTGEQ